MIRKKHELIEHTADIGVRGFGEDLAELFVNTAKGMFLIIAAPKKRKTKIRSAPKHVHRIELFAANREELLVSWLSELLYLHDIHRIIFTRYRVLKITGRELIAEVGAEKFNLKNFSAQTSLKAVTYHQLKISKHNHILQSEVIFDA